MKSWLFDYRCTNCNKLLFRGVVLSGNLQMKCPRCKTDNTISGVNHADSGDDHYALLFDYEGNIIDASNSAEKFLGYSRDELLSMHREDLNTDLARDEYQELRRVLMSGIGSVAFDTIHRKKDRTPLPVKVRVKVLASNGVPMALIIVRPLSEQGTDPRAVTPYEIEINTRGHIVYMNTALIRLLGYRIFTLIGHPLAELIEHVAGNVETANRLIATGKFFQLDNVALRHADGSFSNMNLSFHPRTEDDEHLIGYSIAGDLASP